MHPVKEKILKKLMYSPKLSFNVMWSHEGESNLFAYHLKVLEEDGFVKKDSELYSLTLEGKKFVAYAQGATGKVLKSPLSIVALVIFDSPNNKVLMQERTKEPFYGFWTLPAGKVEYGQFILECAKEECKSETGLTGDFSLKGLVSIKTYSSEVLSFHHNIFIVRCDNPQGKLIKEMKEGKNKWLSLDEIKMLKTFPNMHYNLEIAFGEGFRSIDVTNKLVDDAFVDFIVQNDKRVV